MNSRVEKRWYQFPGVWGLILIPASAVVFGIIMFVVAGMYRDDMVVDNYYADGMAINQKLSMDRRARELNIRASLVEAGARGVIFKFENATDSAIRLSLYHVANRREDREVVLVPEGDQVNSSSIFSSDDVNIVNLLTSEGVWYLELAGVDGLWRLRKRIETPVVHLEITP